MKELFKKLSPLGEEQPQYFLDTCFLYWVFEHNHVKELLDFCEKNIVAITSFNAEEFIHHSKDVQSEIRVHFRTFIKEGGRLFYHTIPVSPGDREGEKEYVRSYDNQLLELIPDPSDAVLIVAVLKEKANVITRDKHHLFTTVLENYLEEKAL